MHAFFDYFDIKIEDLSIEGRSMLARTDNRLPAFGERNWCFCRTFREQMRLLFNIPLQLNLVNNRKL
jgi:hypothetical protein